MFVKTNRRAFGGSWAWAGALVSSAIGVAWAGDAPLVAAVSPPVAEEVWHAARQGPDALDRALDGLASQEGAGLANEPFRTSVAALETNLAARESSRAESIGEVSERLDKEIAEARETNSPVKLSEALASAVALQLLMPNDDELFAQQRIADLIEQAAREASAAESRGDWLVANELYFRLDTLLDTEARYTDDVKRLGARLNMIRLYAPERLWTLRNERRLAEELDPLPPYNPYGDDYHQKLQGINAQMLYRALLRASGQHVGARSTGNEGGTTLADLLAGGLDAVQTMVTTADLRAPFPGLGDETARREFMGTLASLTEMVRAGGDGVSIRDMRTVVERLLDANGQTVRIMDEALVHEFGNGAMGVLDDYTAIIWPDELARFRRGTQGEFIGVGIQIQLDELQNIKVVTPLEGTPAQRAGVRTDDVIKKIDGISAVGLSLDQAVEVITGPADTRVTLTVERVTGHDEEGDEVVEQIDFTLVRKRIDLPSVKGWRKTGPSDYDWDWFIDRDAGVGYVRLTGFTETTTRDFDRAVGVMRTEGLQSLILDLRYNPGGLLDQAVDVASRFVPEGLIVRTETSSGTPMGEPAFAEFVPESRRLSTIPVVVLINEGSASASEIVSGAIQAAAHQGRVRALVVGQRSFGKGSVQNVFSLSGGEAAMKLTTQYYRIDSPRLIHRTPGATEWGIDPDLAVEMLPDQEVQALLLRRDSDVLPLDEFGNVIENAERPDPDRLLTEGIDLQVQTALVLLQSQNTDPMLQSARLDD